MIPLKVRLGFDLILLFENNIVLVLLKATKILLAELILLF